MQLQAGHSEKPSILGLVTNLVSAIIHQSISYQLEYRVSEQVVMVQWEGGVDGVGGVGRWSGRVGGWDGRLILHRHCVLSFVDSSNHSC